MCTLEYECIGTRREQYCESELHLTTSLGIHVESFAERDAGGHRRDGAGREGTQGVGRDGRGRRV